MAENYCHTCSGNLSVWDQRMGKAARAGVLVCDDEPTDLATIRSVLETDPGLRIFTCADFTSCLQTVRAKSKPVNLALLDVALPGRNGVELARELLATNPELKVLFVSGHVGKSVLQL